MFLRRALVVFTLGPLTLLLIYLGGWFYFLPFAALLGVAAFEFTRLAEKMGWRSPLWLLLPISIALWIAPEDVQAMLFGEPITDFDLVSPLLLIGLLAALAYALWLFERRQGENAPGSWMATVGAIVLLGWLGSYAAVETPMAGIQRSALDCWSRHRAELAARGLSLHR